MILSFLKHYKDTFELTFSCCCCIVRRFSGWVVSNFCGHNSNATIYQQVRWTSLMVLSLFWISRFIAYVSDLTFWNVCDHHSNTTNTSGGHVLFWILKFNSSLIQNLKSQIKLRIRIGFRVNCIQSLHFNYFEFWILILLWFLF